MGGVTAHVSPKESRTVTLCSVAILAIAVPTGNVNQSSECESGGSFDLHPETSAFPAEAVPSLPPASLRGSALG